MSSVHSSRRVQSHSPFGVILERYLKLVPGGICVAFVDEEGEAVDFAGQGDEFDIKVSAAQWFAACSPLLQGSLGAPRSIMIEAHRCSYLVRYLFGGYALVTMLDRSVAFHVSERAQRFCHRELRREAGYDDELDRERPWWPAKVRPTLRRSARPREIFIGDSWLSVQVLGAVVGLPRGECGYRVSLQDGSERTLVREPLGRWWTDERTD